MRRVGGNLQRLSSYRNGVHNLIFFMCATLLARALKVVQRFAPDRFRNADLMRFCGQEKLIIIFDTDFRHDSLPYDVNVTANGHFCCGPHPRGARCLACYVDILTSTETCANTIRQLRALSGSFETEARKA